ncbi:hypothetical protein VN97_g3530 [Penicillium thymicola]|uniref:Uncharacterized protein n=1 Tax=Penicillium thymicola TaxID=293382 RepID=A0AAI9TNF2_PENTH|nr:hypothetical protein VN97_g3530 [Penicillium thymicola]
MPKAFLVTGTSSGFGHDLIQEILNHGDIAIATARTPAILEFRNTTENNYMTLKLDVTNTEPIKAAFSEAIKRFGRIDVVLNDAGYGLTGCFRRIHGRKDPDANGGQFLRSR